MNEGKIGSICSLESPRVEFEISENGQSPEVDEHKIKDDKKPGQMPA